MGARDGRSLPEGPRPAGCDRGPRGSETSGPRPGDAGRSAADVDVIFGVADVVPEIRVEVLLDEGTRLIVLTEPFGPASVDGPGAVRFGEGDVALVPDRERRRITVTNTGRRPVRVSSHYPFWQVNPSLSFDREAAHGFRLDLPAGDSLRWAPDETHEVDLVAYGGSGDPTGET